MFFFRHGSNVYIFARTKAEVPACRDLASSVRDIFFSFKGHILPRDHSGISNVRLSQFLVPGGLCGGFIGNGSRFEIDILFCRNGTATVGDSVLRFDGDIASRDSTTLIFYILPMERNRSIRADGADVLDVLFRVERHVPAGNECARRFQVFFSHAGQVYFRHEYVLAIDMFFYEPYNV